MFVPSMLLKKLYTIGSLENEDGRVAFAIKNRLSDARITGLHGVKIDGRDVPPREVSLEFGNGAARCGADISPSDPIEFPLRQVVKLDIGHDVLTAGKHEIEIAVDTEPFGKINFKVDDSIANEPDDRVRIPRDVRDDYSDAMVKARQEFAESYTGVELHHIRHYSFDPKLTVGNIEHFTGVAQVPIGLAGPLTINGEHANGDFLIPLATTEGTLVASYNRGIKLLNLSGGVTCTVCGDAMQRAPVFAFENTRKARDFAEWIEGHLDEIKEEAESTSSIAVLQHIDTFLSNKFVYLRFNFSTGDAAGQNMVGRATFAACSWILDRYEGVQHFYLESNLATDKKSSQVNVMRTRGKRVTAEAVVKRDVLLQQMRVMPEALVCFNRTANIGAILSGANNNGLHSANAITALFIATGQDVAAVPESSAGIVHSELTPDGDLYSSITIPSLIVGTYGGGVSLPTQRECLEMLGCYGTGKVLKLAEIVAAVVLAGELSLASAVASSDWVSSHERYGRNRGLGEKPKKRNGG